MDYLPELADNGQNWTAYGSSVLCAINDKGLMGFLVGSERRPIHPAELEGRGEGWTPQTDEERDEVAVWRTADQSWTQRNATVNYTIICGIPDTIFSSMLHLKSPLEKWSYLESRFGQIPRPESWLAAEQAMQQHDSSSEQDTAGESSQNAHEGDDDESEISPGGHDDPVDSSNDRAETKSGYLTPETEVVDAWQVELHLPVLEVGSMDSEQPDEGANTFEAPDEGGRGASDEVKESQDLPEPSSKALEPEGVTTRQAGGHSMEDMPRTSIEENRCTRTSSETIANVPDPPGTHAKFPTLQIESSMLQIEPEVTGSTLADPSEESEGSSQLRETERPEPHRDRTSEGKFRIDEGRYTSDTPPNKVWGMGVPRTPQEGLGDSADVELTMTRLGIRPLSAKLAGMRNDIPTPPEPPPIGLERAPNTFVDPRRRGRMKTKAENVSNMRTRRNACRARAVLVRPLTLLLAPSKPSTYPAGGLWTTNTGCRKVRYAKRVETRGEMYQTACILMQLVLPFSTPSKRLRYPAGGLWMVNVRYNEVSSTREVQTRQYPCLDMHRQACVTILPFLAPRKRLKPPWGVLRPYRRQGVPPEHTHSVNKPSLFETAASQQRYMAEDSAQQEYSRNGSCDNAACQTRPNIARTWTRSSPAAEYTRFIDGASGGVLEIESPLCDVHFAAYSLSNRVVGSAPHKEHANFDRETSICFIALNSPGMRGRTTHNRCSRVLPASLHSLPTFQGVTQQLLREAYQVHRVHPATCTYLATKLIYAHQTPTGNGLHRRAGDNEHLPIQDSGLLPVSGTFDCSASAVVIDPGVTSTDALSAASGLKSRSPWLLEEWSEFAVTVQLYSAVGIWSYSQQARHMRALRMFGSTSNREEMALPILNLELSPVPGYHARMMEASFTKGNGSR
ncbi:hypothetical protein EDD15DRAFT_2193922 [Pisolithus albus]|nr:hypothetical protein EDD15DRAFT_2193922 [Pisolithus albus]